MFVGRESELKALGRWWGASPEARADLTLLSAEDLFAS